MDAHLSLACNSVTCGFVPLKSLGRIDVDPLYGVNRLHLMYICTYLNSYSNYDDIGYVLLGQALVDHHRVGIGPYRASFSSLGVVLGGRSTRSRLLA